MRSDIHSPTNFDPAAYSYVGSFDNWPEPGAFMSRAEAHEIETPFGLVANAFTWEHAEYIGGRRLLREHGAHVHFDPDGGQEQCDHCGARTRYVTVYKHAGGEYIAVGDTCAQNAFGCSDRRTYDILKLKKAAAGARERGRLMPAASEFLQEHAPELEPWLLTPAANDVHPIFADLGRKLIRSGSLSDKQIAFAAKLLREHFERQRNGGKTDRQLEIEKERETAEDCPVGRVSIAGEVVKVKEQESQFGPSLKITVKDDRGFLVWLTCPASIAADVEAGRRVSLTATVQRSERDSKFGFGKRPSNAKVLAA